MVSFRPMSMSDYSALNVAVLDTAREESSFGGGFGGVTHCMFPSAWMSVVRPTSGSL